MPFARIHATRTAGRLGQARRWVLAALLTAAVAGAADEVGPAAGLQGSVTIDLGAGVTMEFILVRPGTFIMGTDNHEPDEAPPHAVTLTQPYYLAKYEVTQAQWERVMGSNPSHFRGPDRPVENVSWHDGRAFVAALRRATGRAFSLPTEAQWEYACRAGTRAEFSFGDDELALPAHAWFAPNAELATHPVGGKKPNPWGFHDLHGNVYEWCADWYSEGPYPAGAATDPVGPSAGWRRVMRGGGWIYVADNLRSSDRGFSPPDARSNEVGLRCVLWPESEGQVRVASDANSEPAPPASAPRPSSLDPRPPPLVSPPDPRALPATLVVALPHGVTMELVLIRPGTFVMGSDAVGPGFAQPAHRVTLTRPFYLGRHEVTQRQWAALMSRNPSAFGGESPADGPNLPVDSVNWHLCQAFLARLSAIAPRYHFRLPTEAEWEYACRAGSPEDHHFSAGPLDDYAWYAGNAGGRTHPVGLKKPNAWGLHDMYGNVWEWCADRFGPYYPGSATDPTGSAAGDVTGARVVRGGAWNSLAKHVSSSFRHDVGAGMLMRYYGFRCVATLQAADDTAGKGPP